jgi:amino acid permease
MSYHAVVTVDLDNFVSSAARNKFNEELKKKKFTQRKLTTLWTAIFAAGTSRAWAENYVRDSIDAAAASAGISTYEAFVSISEAPPIEWAKKGKESLVEALKRFQN